MPRGSSFYVVKDIAPPAAAPVANLAEFYQVPPLSNLEARSLARLAGAKARAGDWCVRLSVTTLIALLAAVEEGRG